MNMEIALTRTLVGKSVNELRIGMEIEDNGLIVCENRYPFFIRDTVRMITMMDQFEKIDHINKTDLQIWNEFSKKCSSS